MNTVTVKRLLDEDGITKIIEVPLTNLDKSVTLFEADWNLLLRLGLDPRFRFSLGHVVQRGVGRLSVARLISNAGAGEKVQYLDSNPFNLRRTNLVNSIGGGKVSTRDKLAPSNRPHTVLNRKAQINTIDIKPSWKQ